MNRKLGLVGKTQQRTKTRYCPSFDVLEDRCVPSAVPPGAIAGSDGTIDYRGQIEGVDPTPIQQQALAAWKQTTSGLSYHVDMRLGTPSSLINNGGFLTGTAAGDPVNLVMNFLSQYKDALGLQPSDLAAPIVVNSYAYPIGDFTVLAVQQSLNGMPVYNAVVNAGVMSDGRIVSIGNGFVPGLVQSVSTLTPTVSAAQAVTNAAINVGINLTQPLSMLSSSDTGRYRTVFASGEASEKAIVARLELLPLEKGATALAWSFQLDVPNKKDEYFQFHVDANTGAVWLRESFVKNDSYLVFDNLSPLFGGQTVKLNPADPIASPWGWHDENALPGPEYFWTRGNNASVKEDRDGDGFGGAPTYESPGTPGANNYNYAFRSTLSPLANIDAIRTNAFYWTNRNHDTLWAQGFREINFNLQNFNYGRGGTGRDYALVWVQSDADNGTTDDAFTVLSPEGFIAEIFMFEWDFSTPFRDGLLDNDILNHEYFHQVSARLIGGGSNIGGLSAAPQSGGMSEGWSDFNAIWQNQRFTDQQNGRRTTGNYVLGQTTLGGGVRRLPYSYNRAINPQSYDDIDPLQSDVGYPANPPLYPPLPPVDEIHAVGEIWCGVLNDMLWNYRNKYGFTGDLTTSDGGEEIMMRTVLAGLTFTRLNPTFLNGRDGILAADQALYNGANRNEIWDAFARRGMGFNAFDGGGPTSTNVREDYTNPAGPPAGGGGGNNGGHDRFEANDRSDKGTVLGRLAATRQENNLTIFNKPALDQDWFRFRLSRPGNLQVFIDNLGTGDIDLRLYRLNVSGGLTQIGGSFNRAGGADELVNLAGANTTDLYFIQIYGFNGAQSSYNLRITPP